MDSRQFKEKRKELGLSLTAASRELCVSRATICRWESRKSPPKLAVKLLSFVELKQKA